MNKKIVMIIILIIVTLVLAMIHKNSIIRLFKQIINLNYHEEIIYIELGKRFSDDGNIIRIDNHEDIEKIIGYLNTLDLIEERLTEYKHISDFNDIGYFTIRIVRVGDEYANIHITEGENVNSYSQDLLSFETNFVTFTPNSMDWKSTRYYIKNSGYNHQTKSSNVYKFLLDLINKE